MDKIRSSKGGSLPVFLITLSVIGIIIFLLFVYLLPSSRNKFSSFFQKPASQASQNQVATASAQITGTSVVYKWNSIEEIEQSWNIAGKECLRLTENQMLQFLCSARLTHKKSLPKNANAIISGSMAIESEINPVEVGVTVSPDYSLQNGNLRLKGIKDEKKQQNNLVAVNNQKSDTIIKSAKSSYPFKLVMAFPKTETNYYYYVDNSHDPVYKMVSSWKETELSPTVYLSCIGNDSKTIPICSFGPLTISTSK